MRLLRLCMSDFGIFIEMVRSHRVPKWVNVIILARMWFLVDRYRDKTRVNKAQFVVSMLSLNTRHAISLNSTRFHLA